MRGRKVFGKMKAENYVLHFVAQKSVVDISRHAALVYGKLAQS